MAIRSLLSPEPPNMAPFREKGKDPCIVNRVRSTTFHRIVDREIQLTKDLICKALSGNVPDRPWLKVILPHKYAYYYYATPKKKALEKEQSTVTEWVKSLIKWERQRFVIQVCEWCATKGVNMSIKVLKQKHVDNFVKIELTFLGLDVHTRHYFLDSVASQKCLAGKET